LGIKTLGILLAAGAAYWLYHCIRILSVGLTTLGIDTYGATWGILVANAVHIIGISHVGIAISASVRVLRLDQYRNVARVAEIVTLISLIIAVINLLLHVGRPERFIVNVFLYGKWHSPLVWSMTSFTLYFLASSAYLYLSMRRDLWVMGKMAPRWRGFYRALSLGYRDSPDESERHERALYWMALCLIPIMLSVHSVYGLLFGMLSAKAGWYNPLQAPYFVLGAIVSGFSAIIFIAALLRRLYSWQNLLTDRLFRVLGIFLAFTVFLYLYFILSEHLTAQYLPMTTENAVSDSLLSGRFSALFWTTAVVGLMMPFVYLLVQGTRRNFTHVGLTATAALLVNVALWLKRYLFVVPSQFHPQLSPARPPVEYVPTHTEWTAALGSYVAGALALAILLRFLPMFELPISGETTCSEGGSSRAPARRLVMLVSLLVGLSMIFWGVVSRHYDLAPVKWLIGLALLVAIPIENCLIGNRPPVESKGDNAQA
jgi:molybdopterin-containing oxidoreductase family membrane subunit